MLTLVDEYTRECLAIDCSSSLYPRAECAGVRGRLALFRH